MALLLISQFVDLTARVTYDLAFCCPKGSLCERSVVLTVKFFSARDDFNVDRPR